MKHLHGWWFPDHEQHLPEWLAKVNDKKDGRLRYQGKKQDAVLGFCKDFRTAVDIGAHVGLMSYYFAKRFRRVVAFEPVLEHAQCFEKNVTTGNVSLVPYALGDRVGTCAISTEHGSSGNSFISGYEGEISMRMLDDFDYPDVDLIKIDAEGFEENIVRGALDTIKRCKPVMLVEQKRHAAINFGLDIIGAVNLLESIGMRQLRPPMSGDYIMGF